MILGAKLKQAIEKSPFSTEDIADKIEMSAANLYKLYKKDSFEIKYLLQIANILKLPVGHFLNDETIGAVNQSGIVNQVGNYKKQKIMSDQVKGIAPESSVNLEEIIANLKICESEKAGLQEQLKLKDQLLAMKDELIEQLKK